MLILRGSLTMQIGVLPLSVERELLTILTDTDYRYAVCDLNESWDLATAPALHRGSIGPPHDDSNTHGFCDNRTCTQA